ncbi:MAG: hypothetical protein E5W81_08010 [Mesorhizobium sp.]|nr:MAG: hypothetical protein E5W70_04580 [Mesorhizobium sp.]TIX43825.1 MAG: hypothetical protein E5V36_11255 [Mesorhizobium sp.]TKB88331.1 MAG: hypothetical protein E5W81_08010 [Mesorhizobium sp.]
MSRGLPRTCRRREAGLAPPKAGLIVRTTGQGGACRTVFSFNAMPVPLHYSGRTGRQCLRPLGLDQWRSVGPECHRVFVHQIAY